MAGGSNVYTGGITRSCGMRQRSATYWKEIVYRNQSHITQHCSCRLLLINFPSFRGLGEVSRSMSLELTESKDTPVETVVATAAVLDSVLCTSYALGVSRCHFMVRQERGRKDVRANASIKQHPKAPRGNHTSSHLLRQRSRILPAPPAPFVKHRAQRFSKLLPPYARHYQRTTMYQGQPNRFPSRNLLYSSIPSPKPSIPSLRTCRRPQFAKFLVHAHHCSTSPDKPT